MLPQDLSTRRSKRVDLPIALDTGRKLISRQSESGDEMFVSRHKNAHRRSLAGWPQRPSRDSEDYEFYAAVPDVLVVVIVPGERQRYSGAGRVVEQGKEVTVIVVGPLDNEGFRFRPRHWDRRVYSCRRGLRTRRTQQRNNADRSSAKLGLAAARNAASQWRGSPPLAAPRKCGLRSDELGTAPCLLRRPRAPRSQSD